MYRDRDVAPQWHRDPYYQDLDHRDLDHHSDRRPEPSPRPQRRVTGLAVGLLVAGLVVGAAGTTGVLAAAGWRPRQATVQAGDIMTSAASPAARPSPTRAAPRTPAARPRTAFIDDVNIGECFNLPSGPIRKVFVVACNRPHNRELFGKLTLRDGPWPGEDSVRRTGLGECGRRFTAYVGRTEISSVYTYTSIRPAQETWLAGDRLVACALWKRDRTNLTASARGTRR